MRCVDNLDDRVDVLLRQIAKCAERRDAVIESVSQTVSDTAALSACIDEVRGVARRMLPSFVDSGAGLAKTISVSAALAEQSSRRVKRLDMLLRRVKEAKLMADSLQEMRRTVSQVSDTVCRDDLEKAVQLITAYEAAREKIGAHNNPGTSQRTSLRESAMVSRGILVESSEDTLMDGAQVKSNGMHAEAVIVAAREKTRERLLEKFRAATRENDKLTIMTTTRLLTQLGYHEEGCGLYCTWLCEHTIAALNKIVERELRKMDDPNEAGMSHLALVSTALDVVVAAFEGEEEFARETFGNAGPLKLLTELHSKSTSQCVPVMTDFLKKRQEVLSVVTQSTGPGSPNNAHGTGNNPFFHSPTQKNNNNNTGNSMNNNNNMTSSSSTIDPRRTDQILEEMSHLVSCCHLYWAFAQSKQQEYTQNGEISNSSNNKKQGQQQSNAHATSSTATADSFWSSQDNPLMNTVQEILSVFVPLQTRYLNAAFDQALRLQMDALMPVVQNSEKSKSRASDAHAPVPAPGHKTAGTFMGGLAAFYASTTGGASESAAVFNATARDVPITLPDDVFFFLRIALHRAVNTKSTQIVSAVFMACMELVQTRLFPELQRHAAAALSTVPGSTTSSHSPTQGSSSSLSFTTDERSQSMPLNWINATQRTATYTSRLGDELRHLARSHFTGRDVLRFVEQAEDTDVLSKEFSSALEQWLSAMAAQCTRALVPHLERFTALSYNITEETFYQYELSDPWAQGCVAEAEALLFGMAERLDAVSFDTFLLALVRRVVHAMWQSLTQKQFSPYGALQVDRDVRVVRAFFLGRAHEVLLREQFQPLASAASLLLLDNPKDAEHERYEGLSSEEKRRVLCCRVDFKREEIAKLRL